MRQLVAMTWQGPRLIRGLGLDAAQQPERVAGMGDDEIEASLVRLQREGVLADMPATPEDRRARLAAFPTQADLDAIADELVARGADVRPTVRVLEQMPSLRARGVGQDHGPAGGPIPEGPTPQ